MLVWMSFTITMAIFGSILICCLMVGCNDRLAAAYMSGGPLGCNTHNPVKHTDFVVYSEVEDGVRFTFTLYRFLRTSQDDTCAVLFLLQRENQ